MMWIDRLRDRAERRAWDRARRQHTPHAHFSFVSRFPESVHTQEATAQLEELDWREWSHDDTLSGYESYLDTYAHGTHDEQARARIEEIEAENRAVAQFVRELLPKESGCEVSVEEGFVHKQRRWKWERVLLIAIHVSMGHSPADAGPIVKGEYCSSYDLRRLVKHRVAEIFRAVLPSVGGLRLDEVEIAVCHGVRFQRVDAFGRALPPSQEELVLRGLDRVRSRQGVSALYRNGESGSATTLYSAAIRVEAARGLDWASLSDDAIQKAWRAIDSVGSVRFRGLWKGASDPMKQGRKALQGSSSTEHGPMTLPATSGAAPHVASSCSCESTSRGRTPLHGAP
jgi:hypothetical protein